ncbi:MAG TPA: HAD-IG family 5'-nucleotidase, partial [Haliangium sp.]|nr:HAD-IG family 5'-nucleotidase [Haliangium sp.]
MIATNLDVRAQLSALLGDIRSETGVISRGRVYCNRNLRLTSIEYIGFDMDYTLALYQQEQMEKLSIDLTLKYLIEKHGYGEEILELRYDPRFAIRGLVVDRKLGNVLKMDRHGYVRRVYHGFRLLTKAERREHYHQKRINLSHKRYVWIDTLFALPEAIMYVTLVDHFDELRGKVDYAQLYDDICACIDLAHRDDSLKSIIKADLSAYIIKDPALAETLHKLRSAGKKLFLLTNSYYDYTRAVMAYLLDGAIAAYPSWRDYFD